MGLCLASGVGCVGDVVGCRLPVAKDEHCGNGCAILPGLGDLGPGEGRGKGGGQGAIAAHTPLGEFGKKQGVGRTREGAAMEGYCLLLRAASGLRQMPAPFGVQCAAACGGVGGQVQFSDMGRGRHHAEPGSAQGGGRGVVLGFDQAQTGTAQRAERRDTVGGGGEGVPERAAQGGGHPDTRQEERLRQPLTAVAHDHATRAQRRCGGRGLQQGHSAGVRRVG